MTDKETRPDATERVTCQVAAWLWHSRKCRTICREIGLKKSGRICQATLGLWRLDLVGIAPGGLQIRVEVKGTMADLKREKLEGTKEAIRLGSHIGLSKWDQEDFSQIAEHWLACGDEPMAWRAYGDCPSHWGVVFFDDKGKMTALRKPFPVATSVERLTKGESVAVNDTLTGSSMPKNFSAKSKRLDKPWIRLLDHGWIQQTEDEWTCSREQCQWQDRQLTLI